MIVLVNMDANVRDLTVGVAALYLQDAPVTAGAR